VPAPAALRRWKQVQPRPTLSADDAIVADLQCTAAGSARARQNEIEQRGGGLAQRDGRAWNRPDPG
jgi:hypothetical protein